MIRTKQLVEPEVYRTAELVPANPHSIYLQLEALIDDWAALAQPLTVAFCAHRGRPTDPIVYYKIFLIAYFENLTYDTDLAERIDDSRAIRRFLHYTLTEATPDHSTISEVRGQAAAAHVDLAALLTPVIALCRDAGLVGGDEQAVDSTLVPANASLSSLRSLHTGQGVREYFRSGAPVPAPEAGTVACAEPPPTKSVSNADFRSTTDPDARIARKDGHPRDMAYRLTHVTDQQSHIILGVAVDHADGGEVSAACPVVLEAATQLALGGQRLHLVSADTGYDDATFHAFVEQMGGTPVTGYRADTTPRDPAFKKAHFVYDASTDSYRCPRGAVLSYTSREVARRRRRYTSAAPMCAVCPDRDRCLAPKATHRELTRHEEEASRERNCATCHTDAGRAALQHRKHLVEPPFGHLKTYGGLGLVNCRGLGKAGLKGGFAALAWNLIQYVKHAPRTADDLARVSCCALRAALRAVVRWRTAALQVWSLRDCAWGTGHNIGRRNLLQQLFPIHSKERGEP